MFEIDWTRCALPPMPHQRVGVLHVLAHPGAALFDEVGVGKSKQAIDAAHVLYDAGEIDAVVVVAPGFARSVWCDPNPVLGEVAKHAWPSVANVVHEYHARTPRVAWERGALNWVVTNYEFLRRPERLEALKAALSGRRFLLVVDESWAVKSHKSIQTKAVAQLRAAAARGVILNGTPVANSPLDLYAQACVMLGVPEAKRVLAVQNFFMFRARYAVMGGWQGKQILGWQNLDDLNRRLAPFVLARLKRECVALPPVVTTHIEARLEPATWNVYRAMRDDLVVWFDSENSATVAAQAGVRVLRLAQITSGFVGGVEAVDPQGCFVFDEGSEANPLAAAAQAAVVGGPKVVREIGREKLDALLERLSGACPDKLLVWSRFRAELERAAREFAAAHPSHQVHRLQGNQSPEEREAAKLALAPDGDPAAAAVFGNAQAGGAGLNLAAAGDVFYLSNDFNLRARKQADGRVDRPGQRNACVTYTDVLAVGPKGQHTVDHAIASALREKDDIARWTVDQWRRALAPQEN